MHLGKRPGQMLDAERVGIAGDLERCAFVAAIARFRSHLARSQERRQTVQDLRQIGVHACDGRPAERSRKIAVLAMRRTSLGDVELPVGAWRNGLQLACAFGSNHHGQRRLCPDIFLRSVPPRRPVSRFDFELDDLGAEAGRALHDCPPMLPTQCFRRNQDLAGNPQPAVGAAARREKQLLPPC